MAEIPDDSEIGLKILNFYKEQNIRAGEMILIQSLHLNWINTGEREDDFLKGIQWLGDQGFLEQKNENDTAIFLTEKGFEEL